MLNQVNRALSRTSDTALHKIKGAANTGRINTHAREPPKGPTPKGPRQLMNQINRAPAMQQPRPMQGAPMNPMSQANSFATLSPQQQMQLLGLYEEQARMMAQILSPAQQMSMSQMGPRQPNFPQQAQPPAGRSLFERVNTSTPLRPTASPYRQSYQNGVHQQHISASGNPSAADVMDPASSMEVETSSQPAAKSDPSTTMCYFNLGCTKADCHFVHQSPVAPPGTTVDMTDICSFGAACKNRKCVGKHPSPAKIGVQKAQEECKFYPMCTNPVCPFKHPSTPPCRNGADCTVEGCKFAHSTVPCRFDPCLNPACTFKHQGGQKRGTFQDKIWINQEDGDGDGKKHVSERKFVDDAMAEEELVVPGNGNGGQDEATSIF